MSISKKDRKIRQGNKYNTYLIVPIYIYFTLHNNINTKNNFKQYLSQNYHFNNGFKNLPV